MSFETLRVMDRRLYPGDINYLLACACANCGMEHVAMITRAEKPMPQEERCPFCYVEGRLQYTAMRRALELIKQAPDAKVLVQRDDEFYEMVGIEFSVKNGPAGLLPPAPRQAAGIYDAPEGG